MPSFEYSEEALLFARRAYELGWVMEGFDWPRWKDTTEAQRLLESNALSSATPDQLAKLLTVVIRQDRFVEGQLAWAFESGLIAGIVSRAAALLREMDSSA